MKRVFLIVLDSFGIGAMPDSADYGDIGVNTLASIAKSKKFKADIVPVGICGFDGYAKKLFEKNITVKIGKPIPYTLDEDEIVKEWARQICEFTGFENRVEQKETVSV